MDDMTPSNPATAATPGRGRTRAECINSAAKIMAAALIRIERERLMAELASEPDTAPETGIPTPKPHNAPQFTHEVLPPDPVPVADPGAQSPERTARLAAEIRAELGRQNKRIPELAAGTGINAATLRRRLQGERPFFLEEVDAIAQFLGFPVSEIVVRSDLPE